MTKDSISLTPEEYLEVMREKEGYRPPADPDRPTNRPDGIASDPVETARIQQENIKKYGIGGGPSMTIKPSEPYRTKDGRWAVSLDIPGLKEVGGIIDGFEVVGDTPQEALNACVEYAQKLVAGVDHLGRRGEFEYALRTRKIS
jgi:hypothetical protein